VTSPSQPERPDTGHPYPSYAELQAENERLRDQLETIRTAVVPIGVGVDLIRRNTDLLDTPEGGEQS
jgi:hypothetical protein